METSEEATVQIPNIAYVGVNFDTEEVTTIARYQDSIIDDYMLVGEHSPECDGTIYLHPDDSFDGRRALAIALAEDAPIGLGWTFKVIPLAMV